MNVKQLKQLLDRMDDEDKVVIPVSRGQPAVGPKQVTGVKTISQGFDWDKGKVFLNPEELVAVADKQTEVAKKFYDRVIQSWSLACISGWETGFTHTLKNHFRDMLDYSGMGEYIKTSSEKHKNRK